MAIQIVNKDEKLVYKMAGSRIFYRRITASKRKAIINANTQRGETDWEAVTADLIDFAIIGWENIQDQGKDVPFDDTLKTSLPEDVLSDIVKLLGGTGAKDEGGPKNSGTSSSGS